MRVVNSVDRMFEKLMRNLREFARGWVSFWRAAYRIVRDYAERR